MPAESLHGSREAQVLANVPGTLRRLLSERETAFEKTAQVEAELHRTQAALKLADQMDAHGMFDDNLSLAEKVASVTRSSWSAEEIERRTQVLEMTAQEASGVKVGHSLAGTDRAASTNTSPDDFYAEVLDL